MRAVIAAPALAFALTLAYAAAVQPGWEAQFNDQLQYLSLARGLVERSEFTRAVIDEPFIAETYRLPGYPLLIAPTCVGGCDHWRIALLQGALVAALVVAAGSIARHLVSGREAMVMFAVALYLPFGYYASLALSDAAGATLFGLGVAAWLRARERGSVLWAVAAGALLGWASLVRAALLFAPLALGAVALLRGRRGAAAAIACVIGAAIVVAPYVAYSERAFARPLGGTSGLVLWLGVLQVRTESQLDDVERREVAAARADITAYDAIADRRERALAWSALDDSLGARARVLIAHDPLGWLARAVPRSLELWAGDVPLPRGGEASAATVFAFAQLLIVTAGIAGALLLARRGGEPGILVAVIVAYVWATAFPFQTEGRYSLPAKVFVLVGAVALVDRYRARWSSRRRATR